MKKLKFKVFDSHELDSPGYEIIDFLKALVKEAKNYEVIAVMEMNGCFVLVAPDSDPDLLFRDQIRSQQGIIDSKIVGPYPEKELSVEESIKYSKYFIVNH